MFSFCTINITQYRAVFQAVKAKRKIAIKALSTLVTSWSANEALVVVGIILEIKRNNTL